MKTSSTTLLLPLLLGIAGTGAVAQIDSPVVNWVETEIAKGSYTGMLIAVLQDGQATYRGFGLSDQDGEAIPDEHTVFEAGSITKTFTGTLLASAVLAGDLSLDTPLLELLPDGVTLRQTGERAATLADLATHHSGLPRIWPDFAPADALDPYADYDETKLWRSLSLIEPVPAGSRYEYSNLGYGLLGHLLARQAGQDYATLLRETVLEPLGMENSTAAPDDDWHARSAIGYQNGTRMPYWHFDAMAGAGALHTTAEDLLRYLGAHLMPDTTSELHQALAMARAPRADMEVAGIRIGLAWNTLPGNDGVHWHDGGTYGFRSFAGIDPARNRAVVIWTNSFRVDDYLNAVGLHLLRPDTIPLPPPISEPAAVTREETTLPDALLAEYPGSYALEIGADLVLRLEGGTILAQLTGQPEFPIYAEAPDRFFYRVVDAQIEFVRNAEGTVTGMILHQNGQSYRGERK